MPAASSSGAGQREPPTRRRFLAWLGGALGAVGAAIVAIPAVSFLIAPARRQPPVWRAVGAVESFAIGQTVLVSYPDPEPLPWEGFAERSTAWLRRESADEFVAFSPYCTHVGCPVTWTPGAEMFMCPCHGGTFHRDGRVAAGPPPRPLERLEVRIHEGQVELRPAIMPLAS